MTDILHPILQSCSQPGIPGWLVFLYRFVRRCRFRRRRRRRRRLPRHRLQTFIHAITPDFFWFLSFWQDWRPWPIDYQNRFWSILVDCRGTKSEHIDWILGLQCDHRVWLWSWSWPRIFKGQFLKSCISGIAGPNNVKWKGRKSIGCWVNNVTLTFGHMHGLNHRFSRSNSLGFAGGKHYQKITIPIFGLVLQNFVIPGYLSYTRFYRYLFSLLSSGWFVIAVCGSISVRELVKCLESL